MNQEESRNANEIASRRLTRATRAARQRPMFDTEALKAANTPFLEEDAMLAESGSTERADLLAQEDA
jgi:hypothetical protein